MNAKEKRFRFVCILFLLILVVLVCCIRGVFLEDGSIITNASYRKEVNLIEIEVHWNESELNPPEYILRGEDVLTLHDEYHVQNTYVFQFDIIRPGYTEIFIVSDNIDASKGKYAYDGIFDTYILVTDDTVILEKEGEHRRK